MEEQTRLGAAFWALKIGLGASAFLAGADKFTNLLTRWEKYLAPEASRKLPISNRNFMRAVGVVEMLVGAGILTNRTRLASYAATAWLAAIAGDLIMNEQYDIAVRDVNMALGAFALAQLSSIREQHEEEEGLVERRLHAA
jgi:uncharacterized membrane protein YphA (DoxX/SURF4 family)